MADMNQIKKRIAQANSISFVSRSTGLLMTMLKAISGVNFDFADTSVEYRGGNSGFPYACDVTMSNSAITFTSKEFPPELLNLCNRTTAVETEADATGTVGDITDITGTSMAAAATGIASIAETVGSTMKDGKFVFKYVSATTIDIYCYDDADDINCSVDEEGKVNATPYTLTDAGETVITELGFTITGGTTVAIVEDDSAYVVIKKANLGTITSTVGVENTADYVKAIFSQKRQTGGTITRSTFYKCLVTRGAIDNPDGENATEQITVKPVIDPDNGNNVFEQEWTIGENA